MSKATSYNSLEEMRRAVGLDSVASFDSYSINDLAKCYPVLDSMRVGDSAGSVFFLRQLEFIKAKQFEVLYADLPARDLFPVTNEAGPGKTHITYRVYDRVGQAALVGNMADDVPRADVFGKEFSIPVQVIASSYGYDLREIQASQVAGGKPLDQRRADAAHRALEEKVNTFAIYGTADAAQIPGWFNNPYIPAGVVATGGLGDTRWIYKTPDEILADMNGLASSVNVTSKKIETPDTLVLPVAQYNYINQTPRSALSDTTILKYFLQNNQMIKKVVSINELAGAAVYIAGTTGGDSNDVMFVYTDSADKLELEIPVEMTQTPPQQVNLTFKVIAWMQYAGINVYYPGSAAFAGGI